MTVKFNIKKQIKTVIDQYGNQTTKDEWLAKKDREMGLNLGGNRPANSISERSGKTKASKKE